MFWIFTENKRLLQEAKLALIKSKREDYDKIVGVHENASTDEIKKAYRKRALVHHPG
jgi:DnaJ family protein C protein 7